MRNSALSYKLSALNFTKSIIVLLLIFVAYSLQLTTYRLFAEAPKNKVELTECICEAGADSPACLDELKNIYFSRLQMKSESGIPPEAGKNNKYSEFAEILKKLCPDNKDIAPSVNYYLALTRYTQLKYLEETKGWDEYFAKGNDYRQDIVDGTKNAISATIPQDTVHIKARLLVYQFHKDQQDAFVDASLTDLVDSVLEYAQSGEDIKTIKEAADSLWAYDEKVKSRELYKIYAQKLSGPQIKDEELKEIAANSYKERNVELAQNVYDIYIERIAQSLSKEKFAEEMVNIGRDFAFKDSGVKDPAYAEKIFKRIEDIAGKDVFDEELNYLRGFNLEKAKSYAQAKDIYIDFLKRFPDSSYADELIYKTGVIFTYILRDIKEGRVYFERLAQKSSDSTHALAGLYQLGLLKQWEQDLAGAKGYYNNLLEKIGSLDPDRLALTQARLKEIEEGKPLEYNLKTALDTALKEEYANLDMSRLDLKSNLYRPQKGKEVDISSAVFLGSSGCLQMELQYLWSGDTGGASLNVNQPDFKASYKSPGTQVIFLVLISPTGITERNVDLIDVY